MVNVKRKVLAWILSVLTILASCAGAVVPSFGEEVIASSSTQESPKVQVLVDVETCGGSVVVGEGTKDQVTLCRNEDGALREVDASGEEMVLDEPVLLIRDVGEVLPIRAVSEKGYEVASYTVQSSLGEEENLFPQSDSCYFEVIADTNKAVSVRFEKKEEVQKSSAGTPDQKEKKVEKTPTPTKEAKREAKIIRSGTVNGHHWVQTEDGEIILDDGTVYHPVYPSKEAVEKRASEDHSSTEDSSTDKKVRNLLDPADFWLSSAEMELVGAASAPSNVPRSFSGSGTVVWRDNGTESYAFKFAVTSGSPAGAKTGLGQVSLGCADYTAAAPEVGMSCSYTATYQSWDPATGTAKYELYATPPGATDGVSRNAYGLMGYQHLSGVVSLRFPTDGHLKLQKVSANPSITKGNACYSLSGAVYGVYKDAACTTLATGSYDDNGTVFNGYLTTGNDGTSRKVKIPEGTYYIKEKSASKGYKVDASRHVVAIKNGETALVKSEEVPVNDPGSIVLKKKSSDEQAGLGEASLKGAKFQLKEDWEGGKTYVFETDAKGGISFSDTAYLSQSSTSVPTKIGDRFVFALGSYTITEISAPAGYLPMEGELKVEVVADPTAPGGARWKIISGDRDITQSVDASGEVNWELIEYVAPYIHTEATDANTKSHLGVRKSEDTLVDTVTYGGLDPKTTYVLTGTLMDKETGKEVPGVSTKPVTFQPSAANGTENVTFTFDSTTLAQGDVVVFETLTKKSNGESVAEHKDLSDKGQTVVYPSIGTTATDAATKDHDASYGSDVEIVDEVRVGHLVPYVTDADGNETKEPVVYTIKGHLVFQKDFTTVDGKTFAKGDTVPLVNGTKNEVEKTFTAADVSDGKIFLSFHVDTANLTGAEVVAFERLYQDDILLDAEENIENGSQKVAFPKEETTFLDKKNKEHVLYADGQDVEVEDVIKASHLIDGKDYVQEAQLMFASDFTDANGTVHAKGEAIDEAWAKQTVKVNSKTEGFTVEKKTTEQAGDASITYVDGEIRVPFTIPAAFIKSCAGADLVAFEKLKSAGGVPVAAHEDVSDENQTIHIPGGGTHAMDGIDLSEEEWNALSQEELKALYENHTPQMCELAATEEVRIADLVYYENLKADTTYEIEGCLKRVAGGSLKETDVRDDAGNPVTKKITFRTPKSKEDVVSGYVPVIFTFSGAKLNTTTMVAFEKVTREGQEVFVHEDLHSLPQTVYVPSIKTNAADAATLDKEGLRSKSAYVIDQVIYENLTEGETYQLKAMQMDKSMEAALPGAATEGSFTAGVKNQFLMPDGSTKISDLESIKEELTASMSEDANIQKTDTDVTEAEARCGKEIQEGTYEVTPNAWALSDEQGTWGYVHVYEGEPKEDGSNLKAVLSTSKTEKVSVKEGDVIRYFNVNLRKIETSEGETYTIDPSLIEKVKQDLEQAGKAAEAEGASKTIVTGTPSLPEVDTLVENGRASGCVYVVIPVDATKLSGVETVTFEKLYTTGEKSKMLAHHEDLEDTSQSVRYPKMGTTATVGGAHVASPSKTTTLIDTCAFEGLTPGVEYLLTGIAMDKASGKPVMVNGKTLTAEATFTASTSDGSANVTFTFDSSSLDGKEIVIFESLMQAKTGRIVAEHKDLSDVGQTVKFEKTETHSGTEMAKTPSAGRTLSSVQTGDLPLFPLAAGAGTSGLLMLGVAFSMRKRKK